MINKNGDTNEQYKQTKKQNKEEAKQYRKTLKNKTNGQMKLSILVDQTKQRE